MTKQQKSREEEHRQTIRRNRSRRERSQKKRNLGGRLLLVAAVTAAVVCSLAVFFKVRTVEIRGNEAYDTETVEKASGIRPGDNLLTIRKSAVAGKLHSALPYVESVHISCILPGTVVLEITESETVYRVMADKSSPWAIDAEGQLIEPAETAAAWLINAEGKMIEPADGENDASACSLTGLTVHSPETGKSAAPGRITVKPTKETEENEKKLSSEERKKAAEAREKLEAEENKKEEERLSAAILVMTALRGTGLTEDIVSIDLTKPYDIVAQYQDRFEIWLGGTDQLDYKLRYLKSVLKELDSYQTGTIDLTFDEEKVARFIPV